MNGPPVYRPPGKLIALGFAMWIVIIGVLYLIWSL